MSAWLPSTVVGTLLLALFAYVLGLTNALGKVREDIGSMQSHCTATMKATEAALVGIPVLRHDVDRLVFRQEVIDGGAAEGLHRPTHYERDGLIEGLMRRELSVEELERVIDLLKQARKTERTADDRWRATVLLARAETELHFKAKEAV